MKMALRRLFFPGEPLGGGQFLAWGFFLFFCKWSLDAALTYFHFGYPWWPTDYLIPREGRLTPGTNGPIEAGIWMIAMAAPFVWVGVNLTLRRLRTLNWPASLVCLFFFPYLNVAFFLTLGVISPRESAADPSARRGWNRRMVVSAAVAAMCVLVVAVATVGFESYGWGLFIGVPFFTGFIPALILRPGEPLTFGVTLRTMFNIQCLIAFTILLIRIEGAICIMMAAPLSLGLGMIGCGVGLATRKIPVVGAARAEVGSISFLLLPFTILAETRMGRTPTLFEVTSRIEINASPENVWKSVVTFSELPPPTEMIFRAGLAYPIRAEIQGRGAGAVRECVFSTGPFVEPITVWDEPKLLRFTVTSNPPPMKELSYAEVHPAHLKGFLESEQGQFELKPLPGGRTELVGTTWYRHGLWPEKYWLLWSDYIIHTIHMRVLRHIKSEVEMAPSAR